MCKYDELKYKKPFSKSKILPTAEFIKRIDEDKVLIRIAQIFEVGDAIEIEDGKNSNLFIPAGIISQDGIYSVLKI